MSAHHYYVLVSSWCEVTTNSVSLIGICSEQGRGYLSQETCEDDPTLRLAKDQTEANRGCSEDARMNEVGHKSYLYVECV